MCKQFQFATFTSITLVSVFFASCSKDNNQPAKPVTAVKVSNIVADKSNNGHFAFYSLESGKSIAWTDSATTKWDIAFKNTTILINGGKSGPGKGVAFVQRGTTFENYKTIHADSTFRTDGVNGVTYAIATGGGNGWYSYSGAPNHIISPIAGNLIIVKTASGKYAKVEITSYYKDSPANPVLTSTSAYYSFRYAFQPNGSKTF